MTVSHYRLRDQNPRYAVPLEHDIELWNSLLEVPVHFRHHLRELIPQFTVIFQLSLRHPNLQ